MEVTIREIDVNTDRIEYLNLLKQLTHLDVDSITPEAYLAQLKHIRSNPNHLIYLAEIEGKIVGSITLLIEPKFIRNLSQVAHIEDVVVDSNCRQHGVGRKLVEYVLAKSQELGCYKTILDCSEKNAGFYSKFGFSLKEQQMALYH